MSNSDDKSKAETENGNGIMKETGVVGGSLGMLTSYWDSSSDSDCSPEEGSDYDINTSVNTHVKEEVVSELSKRKSETYLPNPVFEKSDKVALSNAEMVPNTPLKIKQEPLEADEKPYSSIKISEGDVNFSILKKECEEDFDLDVEDFLPDAGAYGEARAVKAEVESGTSDSEADSESSENEDDERNDGDQEKTGNAKRKPEGIKVKGEFGLDDLPPIEDLHISVPHEECKPIGLIKSVVDPLVIVEAYPETPALDLDSVLFLDVGDRALGHIFDVIGPVKQPLYCVRFNSKEHIEKSKVEVGMTVYCAPKTPYTTYVFLAQLRRLKGSDASWLNDIEPPVEEVEYSDDEMERIAKKKKRNRKFQNATEEDAMSKEGEDMPRPGPQFRGRKRQHNHNSNYHDFSHNQTPAVVPQGFPPFMPPMVPGFSPFPFAPPHAYGGPPTQPPWFPGPNHMNHHRVRGFHGPRGPKGPPRFRPPNYGPQESFSNSFQPNPYQPNTDASNWGSWNPPPQWQSQNMANFNFGGPVQNHTPYAHMYQTPRYANPPPPPPSPPPPGQ